jgi:hypothetical protein
MSKSKEEIANVLKTLLPLYENQEAVEEVECLKGDIWTDPNGNVKSFHIGLDLNEDGDGGVKIIPVDGFTISVDAYATVIDCRSYLPGDNDPELGISLTVSYEII